MQANRSMHAGEQIDACGERLLIIVQTSAASCLVLMSFWRRNGKRDICSNFRLEKKYFVSSSYAARTPLEPSFQGARSLTSGSFTSFFTVTIMLLHFSYGTGNKSSTSRSNSGS